MPIYAYKCDACGHAKDALQKISDSPLTTCPACGASAFKKQLTAAGFQLKGSGWYVTDFKNGNNGAAATKKEDAVATGDASSGGSKPAKADAPAAPGTAASTPAASTTSASSTPSTASPASSGGAGASSSTAGSAASSKPVVKSP